MHPSVHPVHAFFSLLTDDCNSLISDLDINNYSMHVLYTMDTLGDVCVIDALANAHALYLASSPNSPSFSVLHTEKQEAFLCVTLKNWEGLGMRLHFTILTSSMCINAT